MADMADSMMAWAAWEEDGWGRLVSVMVAVVVERGSSL